MIFWVNSYLDITLLFMCLLFKKKKKELTLSYDSDYKFIEYSFKSFHLKRDCFWNLPTLVRQISLKVSFLSWSMTENFLLFNSNFTVSINFHIIITNLFFLPLHCDSLRKSHRNQAHIPKNNLISFSWSDQTTFTNIQPIVFP